jgi:hypothetical protein
MSLEDLSLDDLRRLSERLASIVSAGAQLESAGLEPRFDLTPAHPMRITLGAVMPPATRPDFPTWLMAQPKSTEAAPPSLVPEPVDAPLVRGEAAEGAPISAEPSRSAEVAASPGAVTVEAQAESGGRSEAAPAPAAPVPGSASALAGQWQAPMWTAEEDERLIALVVAGVTKEGLTKAAAISEAAVELGRTNAAAKFRCDTKLKDRLKAALAEAALLQAQTETPAIPEAAKVDLGQGEPAVGGNSSAAVKPNDPLMAHLCGMTEKGGWSLARDLDLMELSCAGLSAADIAREIQMPDAAVKPRFDALTGLHDDEVTGKKARRWSREEVLGALLIMAGRVAA